MHTILYNAIISIQLGVEDFKKSSQDSRRVLSAIRNLYAGVLLLFKEKLAQLSPKDGDKPPLYILKKLKVEITQDGPKVKGKGKQTVNIDDIKDRFKSLNIKVNWDRIDKAREIRNNLEHYKLNKSPKYVKEIIWNLLPEIRNFIRNYFKEEPIELLGKETWQSLLEVEEVYQKEWEGYLASLEILVKEKFIRDLIIKKVRCPICSSKLIKPIKAIQGYSLEEAHFFCSSCGKKFKLADIEEFLGESYFSEVYDSVKYSGENPIKICPECGRNAVIYDENENLWVCLACGEVFDRICEWCNCPFNSQDGENICPECLDNKIKDD